MSAFLNNRAIAKEVLKANDSIMSCYERVAALEKLLKTNNLSLDKQEAARQELIEVRKLLLTNREKLSQLEGSERNPILSFTVGTILVCFTLFLFYTVAVGVWSNLF